MWDRIKAWYRGERRVVSSDVRGRIYERKPAGGPAQAVARLKATMKIRVYRGGKWEDV